jgi:hypothetical protein
MRRRIRADQMQRLSFRHDQNFRRFPSGRLKVKGPVEWPAQAAVPSRVNSAACSLTKSYMLIGFWPVSLNRSSVIRS